VDAKQQTLQHKRASGTIVRVGHEAWVVGGAGQNLSNGPSVALASDLNGGMENTDIHRTADEFGQVYATQSPKKLKHSFQTGMITGLALGCLSLFLFHQLQTPLIQPASAVSAYTGNPLAMSTGAAVRVPGIQFYAVTLDKSASNLKKMNQQGIQLAASATGDYLIYQLAVSATGANHIATVLSQNGIHAQIRKLQQNAHPLPTLPGTNASIAVTASRWIASTTSALTTMVASLSDGAHAADAKVAFQASEAMYPGDTKIAQTGFGQQVYALHQAMKSAYQAFQNGNQAIAKTAMVEAYQRLSALRGVD